METPKKEKNRTLRKWKTGAIAVAVLALSLFIYVRFYFVWGEGVKAGQLNYVVYKGYVFKTYEGKLIQAGLKPGSVSGGIQSNEFVFSVSDEAVARKLMLAGGQDVGLHYKEYFAPVLWRGHSKFIVDSIVGSSSGK
ncbi:MAG: hypothetical protein LBH61_03510 [Dysgonamonadaceae bacterium]|jgi:hypothetical protein|nr:hypothetical protein [Dysgonamonadaceae bacterium]